MKKEQLETNLAALKLLESETNDKLTDHKSQIALLEKQLADINKPAITSALMEQIEGAIETAVEDFDFSDDDNFEKEFEIDYDSRIRLSNLDFTNSHDLIAEIAEKVLDLFRETEEEETTTTDNS
tara:strand:- start:209 stop:583 length:375 start_codon:yes stop_codon:yes gene_type:complete